MLDLIDTVNKDTIVIRSESFFIRTSVAATDYGRMMAISQLLYDQYHIWDILCGPSMTDCPEKFGNRPPRFPAGFW